MPKKTVEKETVILTNTGDGTKICDLPGGVIKAILPGKTIVLPPEIADHYLSCGGWKKVKAEKEGVE